MAIDSNDDSDDDLELIKYKPQVSQGDSRKFAVFVLLYKRERCGSKSVEEYNFEWNIFFYHTYIPRYVHIIDENVR